MSDCALIVELANPNIRNKRMRKLALLRWKKRFFKHLPPVTIIILLCIIIFSAGFFYFSEKISRTVPPHPLPKADAIIVLTGGEKRVSSRIGTISQR